MSMREQRETERQEKALATIAKLYRDCLSYLSRGEKEFANTLAIEYMASIKMYITLTGEEEFTVIEYVSNHLTD